MDLVLLINYIHSAVFVYYRSFCGADFIFHVLLIFSEAASVPVFVKAHFYTFKQVPLPYTKRKKKRKELGKSFSRHFIIRLSFLSHMTFLLYGFFCVKVLRNYCEKLAFLLNFLICNFSRQNSLISRRTTGKTL